MAQVAQTYSELLQLFAAKAEKALNRFSPEIEAVFTQTIQNIFQRDGSIYYAHRGNGLLSGTNRKSEIYKKGNQRIIALWDETPPRKSIFKNEIYSGSKTLFFQWINDGQWFDIYPWIAAGFPEDKENYYREAMPLTETIISELKYDKIPQRLVKYINTGTK